MHDGPAHDTPAHAKDAQPTSPGISGVVVARENSCAHVHLVTPGSSRHAQDASTEGRPASSWTGKIAGTVTGMPPPGALEPAESAGPRGVLSRRVLGPG